MSFALVDHSVCVCKILNEEMAKFDNCRINFKIVEFGLSKTGIQIPI